MLSIKLSQVTYLILGLSYEKKTRITYVLIDKDLMVLNINIEKLIIPK